MALATVNAANEQDLQTNSTSIMKCRTEFDIQYCVK